jgi:hypothetical protein|uniref:Uncharacterized protein n=1 Tax=Myoviridae sp. ctYA416 TaxID=2825125 RepID=A0A8S5UTD7_9CAUD|nr:MAG TPA: hypothetical protein [Myoviridae sp. ctYA416]
MIKSEMKYNDVQYVMALILLHSNYIPPVESGMIEESIRGNNRTLLFISDKRKNDPLTFEVTDRSTLRRLPGEKIRFIINSVDGGKLFRIFRQAYRIIRYRERSIGELDKLVAYYIKLGLVDKDIEYTRDVEMRQIEHALSVYEIIEDIILPMNSRNIVYEELAVIYSENLMKYIAAMLYIENLNEFKKVADGDFIIIGPLTKAEQLNNIDQDIKINFGNGNIISIWPRYRVTGSIKLSIFRKIAKLENPDVEYVNKSFKDLMKKCIESDISIDISRQVFRENIDVIEYNKNEARKNIRWVF